MSERIAASVASSCVPDAERAGRQAAAAALSGLEGVVPQLGIVFGSSWFDQAPLLQGVRSVLGINVPIAGNSTAGEITQAGPTSHSCVVALIGSPGLLCRVGHGQGADESPREAGQQAAYQATRDFQGILRVGCLLITDGLITQRAEVIRGAEEALGTNTLIVGAMAADDFRFEETHQYANERLLQRSVVGVLFGGTLKIGVGIEHGFSPISKPHRISRAEGNVLLELDGKRAQSVYEEYFGADIVHQMRRSGSTRAASVYPLGVRSEAQEGWLLRSVVSFGEDGSLLCNGELFEGSWLQLMIGSRELALDAAYRAAQQAIRALNRIACVLVFDSGLRRQFLGPRHAGTEIERIRQAVGQSVPLAGCYTYGEYAPLKTPWTGNTATQTGSILVVALGI